MKRSAKPSLLLTLSGLSLILSSLDARAETSYWLPIVERTPTATTYRYEVKAPDFFKAWLTQRTPLGGGETVTKNINGQDYVFVKQFFTWDTGGAFPAGTGQIRLDNKAEPQRWASDDWKNNGEFKNQADLIRALDSGVGPFDNSWRSIDLLALKWDSDTPPQLTFSEEVPLIDQLKARRAELAKQTRPGKFYPEVKVPADLEGYRAVMLEICNLGRRDPDYRKKNKTSSDLRAEYAQTDIGPQKIHHHSQTPPLFRDIALDERLNDAAQIQAEWAAKTNYMGHDGPPNYQGNNLKDFSPRVVHFAPKYGSAVEAGGWDTSPESWMNSETHYRPWFNIDHDVSIVGFGAAIGGDGKLRTFGVPAATRPHTASAQSASYTFNLPLEPGKELEREKKYPSNDGRHYLIWNQDGNLSIFYPRDLPKQKEKDAWIWNLASSEHKIANWAIGSARISASSQLEVTDKDGKVLWTAPNTKPALSGDQLSQEPVVLIGSAAAPVPVAMPTQSDTLPFSPGQEVIRGKKYPTRDGAFHLIFQDDNNIVVYHNTDGSFRWGLNTVPGVDLTQVAAASFTPAGRFEARDAAGNALWSFPDTATPGMLFDASSAGAPFVSEPDATTTFKLPVKAGAPLVKGIRYLSGDKSHYLTFQLDSNLVVHRASDGAFAWGLNEQPGVDYMKGASAAMAADGKSFLILDSGGQIVWKLENAQLGAFSDLGVDVSPEGKPTLIQAPR